MRRDIRTWSGALCVHCALLGALTSACSSDGAETKPLTPAAGSASGGQGGAPTAVSGGVSSTSTAGSVSAGGSVGVGGSVNAGSGVSAGGGAKADAGAASPPSDMSEAGAASASEPDDAPRSVFYLDVQGSVLTLDEGAKPRTLVASAGQGPDGIAVDVAGGHIFWTTMGVPADDDGSVRRANLDGSGVVTLVPAGGSYTPKQLKLDRAAQKLYWSDREGMRIQRAGVDGSGVETLVTVASGDTARKNAANWCVGLALDLEHGFIYWTQKGPDDGMQGSIRRAHLELPPGETASTRSDVEVLFDGLPEPVDLDLDVSNGYMYWSDRGDDTINRAPIEVPSGASAKTRKDRQIIVPMVREAIGVALDLERGNVYYTGAVGGRVGRAKLDGSDAADLATGSGALTGIAVVPHLSR